MHPILFNFPDWLPIIGGRGLHTYGLMIALGFLFGLWWSRREAKRLNLDENLVVDTFFYTLIAGLVGSRVLYVIHSVPDFWSDPLVVFRVWEGGLVFQGGVIGGVIVLYLLAKKGGLSFFQMLDVYVPALSFAHALGRIGCFFAGCCHGGVCPVDYPLAVTFPKLIDQFGNSIGAAPANIPLYPTQLFESGGELLIFALLCFVRLRKPFHGAVFAFYLMIYSILRFALEFYRGDLDRGFFIEPAVSGGFSLSNGQFLAILGFLFGLIIWFYQKQKQKEM